MKFEKRVREKLEFLYGSEEASRLVKEIKNRLDYYQIPLQENPQEQIPWSEQDAVLITYGDVILPTNGTNKLHSLAEFLTDYLGDAINSVHILPFFPSSSDQGFSVMDYKEVREDLGDWNDIKALSKKYRVMVDLVINHASRFSKWFQNFKEGEAPGKDYFIEVDPTTNLSNVMRPRSSPLLTAVKTNEGLRYVWTTFSDDQMDLDFTNPDVLLEFIDIFLFYLSKGVKMVRLDAIAYLWKKIGTESIHLKETHEIVKLFRLIADYINHDVRIITETNVPFDENVSYFGDGDEAHLIYQFSLPPLLLHALLTENGQYLSDWAKDLPEPPEGCTYFNFTASHDGIGVRPLEGLVPDEEFDFLVDGTEERGGFVSYKKNSDGTQSPYELNITYFDAFAEPGKEFSDVQVKRYICSQLIMLALKGIPGIYFHNLTATQNYVEGVAETGDKRAINRKQWPRNELEQYLSDTSSGGYVLTEYKRLLNIRKRFTAFSPESKQEILDFGNSFFGILRGGDQEKPVLSISNLTSRKKTISYDELKPYVNGSGEIINVLDGKKWQIHPELVLGPFQSVWLGL